MFKFLKKKKIPTERYYQYYAQINPHTCEDCLHRHGDLFTDIALAPPIHPDCRCGFLHVIPDEFFDKQEQAERMKAIAQAELRRRSLFAEALNVFGQDANRGVALLESAVFIDVHIEELEHLREKFDDVLIANIELMETLRDLFVRAYFQKMDHPKYQEVSAGMYGSLETEGRKRIQELFADPHTV